MKNLVLVFFISIIISACNSHSSGNQQISSSILVKTSTIVSQEVTRYHNLSAVLLATKRADLAFQLTGRVDKVLVKVGEQVAKKQVLMSLYNPNITPNLATNLANLQALKVQIYQAKRDVASLRELRKNNSISQTDFEHKDTELQNLLAQEQASQAQIALAQANQQESFILAPYASTVVSVTKQVGEFVAAGQVVIIINQAESMEVEVNVTKSLWQNLALNDTVIGTYAKQLIKFKVIEIAQMADRNSHLYKLILQLKSKLANAIGQQITLRFAQKYKNVYKLPLEVVVDDGINKPYIFTSVNGVASKNNIEPLYIEDNDIVFKAIDPVQGDVVLKGQSKLAAGMQLAISK